MSGNQSQVLAAKLLCAALQELDNTLPNIIVAGSQLRQGRCFGLEEGCWQMFVAHASHVIAGHDFDRLGKGLDLAMADNLVLFILVRCLQALCVRVAENTFVFLFGSLCDTNAECLRTTWFF